MNLLFCGGGTGGHIFPAVALANEFKSRYPDCNIQFVGAIGKMEMEKVPAAGYSIIGLPLQGLIRKLTLKNIPVFFKAIYSLFKARRIIRKFNTTAVIGTGGFASLPVCFVASQMNIPVFVWEGNGFAGLTNQIMKKRAKRIYCGFDGMDKQFPHGNWIHSGNPIRKELLSPVDPDKCYKFFGLSPEKPIIFITGGSLGAHERMAMPHIPCASFSGNRTINHTTENTVILTRKISSCIKVVKRICSNGLVTRIIIN